ncbi:MAG TPA: prepilin-type N-terminal cleavage/methylation domain-containing protein [Solirubrobacteraceae bacterium]|jgi:prepilin-type N-terminal cleavage/methylation domain-containing protein
MRRRAIRRVGPGRVRQQAGFTLVELLIAMVLAAVVFGATLDVLINYTHQYAGTTERMDSQNSARLGVDRIVRQLRNIASPVTSPKLLERATPYDIVFQTIGSAGVNNSTCGANTTCDERVRYCVPPDTTPGTRADEVVVGETQTWVTAAAPADPWSSDPSVTIPCPDTSLPTGVTKSVAVAPSVTNRYQGADRSAFFFNNGSDPSDLGSVFTVQIDLFVNPTPTVAAAEVEIRSGAFLRNQPRKPVPDFTPLATGHGGVLLNGGTSYSPDGEDLSYAWTCTGTPCPHNSTLTGSNQGLVDWTPGAGTYTVQLTITDETGLTATTTKSVTVT